MYRQLIPGVRTLSADDLNIGVEAKAARGHASTSPDAPEVTAAHPLVQEIVRLSTIYGGVILSGPPGTSKSFFAAAAADAIAEHDKQRYRFVQFHASYQYEDFMLGYTPTDSGFQPKDGVFLDLIKEANNHPDQTYVLVIDELSRADVGRVFGEALTYVDRTKRRLPFEIASGEEVNVPSNFIILATMNPFDRGVDEVDAAFERRFAKVSMDPSRELLDEMLTYQGMDEAMKERVLGWFEQINNKAAKNPAAAVGHAYFAEVSNQDELNDLWNYQLRYVVERAFRRDETTRAELEAAWRTIFTKPEPNQGLGTNA